MYFGIALLSGRLFRDAARQCQEAVWLDPTLARAYYCVGLATCGTGDQAGAAQAHDRLRLLAPDLATALFNHMHPESVSP